MRAIALLSGILGLVALVLALWGRFFNHSIVPLFGDSFSSATLLQMAVAGFSGGAFLRVMTMR